MSIPRMLKKAVIKSMASPAAPRLSQDSRKSSSESQAARRRMVSLRMYYSVYLQESQLEIAYFSISGGFHELRRPGPGFVMKNHNSPLLQKGPGSFREPEP